METQSYCPFELFDEDTGESTSIAEGLGVGNVGKGTENFKLVS